MGVGYIRLVDRDVVERSNLQRQYLYDTKTLGYSKAEVAAERLHSLNPHVTLDPVTVSINDDNAMNVIRDVDVVVDGLDAVKPRYAINRAAITLGVPYIFGGAIMTHGNVSTILPHKTPCLECFYSNVDDTSIQQCSIVGVHPSILGIISSIEVAETIRILLGRDPILTGKLLFANLEDLSIDLIKVVKRKDCPVCTRLISPESKIPKRDVVEEVCSREGKRSFIVAPKENLNLQLPKVSRFLQEKGWTIKIEGQYSITLTSKKNMQKISILKSGVMIVEGVDDKSTVIELYRNNLIKMLKIDWSRIE